MHSLDHPAPAAENSLVSGLKIRSATNQDKEAILDLHFAGLDQCGVRLHDSGLDLDLEDVEGNYHVRGGEFLIGELGGEVVCMGAYRVRNASTIEIRRLRVAQPCQGHGLGRHLLRALLKLGADRGFRIAILEVTETQLPARRLYESERFTPVPKGSTYPTTNLVYARQL